MAVKNAILRDFFDVISTPAKQFAQLTGIVRLQAAIDTERLCGMQE